MSRLCLFKVLALLILLLSEKPSFAQPDSPAFRDATHPQREEYIADSLEIMEWYAKGWGYYWGEQFDSFAIMGHEVMRLAAKWMEVDAISAFWYHYAKSDIGHALCKQGFLAEGLPEFVAGNDAMAEHSFNADTEFYLSTNYIGLGRVYESFGFLEEALESYLEGDRIQTKLVEAGDLEPRWLAYKANYLADIYFKLGRFQETENLFLRAIDIEDDLPWSCQYGRYHIDLAALYLSIGYPEKARNLIAAVGRFLASEDCLQMNWLKFLFNKTLADAYFNIDSFSLAAELYHKTVEIVEKDPRVAMEQETKALPFSYYQLSRIHIDKEEWDKALKYLELARSSWLKDFTRNHNFWNQLMLLEGEISFRLGDQQAALDRFHGVLDQYMPEDWENLHDLSTAGIAEWPFSPWVMQALRLRAEVLAAQWRHDRNSMDFADLLRQFKAGQQYLEHYLRTYSTEFDKGKIFSENKSLYNIPIDLLEQIHQSTKEESYLDELFHIVEKSKALQLLSHVRDKQLQNSFGIPDEVLESERNILREMGFYKKQLGSLFRGKKDSADLKLHYQDKLNQLQYQYDSLRSVLNRDYPNYHQLKYDLSVVSSETVKRNLAPDQGILTYYWGIEKLFVLGITKEKIRLWSVPLDEQFTHRLDRFIGAVTRAPQSSLLHSGRENAWLQDGWEIYRQLLEPMASEETHIQKWALVPDGKLAYLPWSALLFDSGKLTGAYRDLPFLVKRFRLQQEYSATLFLMKPTPGTLPLDYLGVAPEYPGDQLVVSRHLDTLQLQYAFGENIRQGYQPLLYNQPEIKNAFAYYANGIELLGQKATESEFKSHAFKGRILHLAMHAFTNDVDPMLSHLAFTPAADSLEDGLLYAYEVYNMNIPADLAILSACNTGNGAMLDGQGVMSLARAFKYAGCQNVLMTLWRAHDHATSKVISNFFDQLQHQNDKADALQKAMLDYLQQERNDALLHPYYWSGFSLIGSDDTIKRKTSFWKWLLPVLVLVVLGFWRKL